MLRILRSLDPFMVLRCFKLPSSNGQLIYFDTTSEGFSTGQHRTPQTSLSHFHHVILPPLTIRTGSLEADHLPKYNFLFVPSFLFVSFIFMEAIQQHWWHKFCTFLSAEQSQRLIDSGRATVSTTTDLQIRTHCHGGSTTILSSLNLSTFAKDAHDHLESFRCQRWGLMRRTDRHLLELA